MPLPSQGARQNTEEKSTATLHLTVEFGGMLSDVFEAAKEIVEKSREQGSPSGFLEIHRAEHIDVDQLR